MGGSDIGRGFEAVPRGMGAVEEAVVGVVGGEEGECVGDSGGRGPR